MSKTASYHRAAVKYNHEAMDFFAGLAERLDDPLVSKWAGGISRQHQFHLNRHSKALAKAEAREQKKTEPTVEKKSGGNYYDEALAMVDAAAELAKPTIPDVEIPAPENTIVADQIKAAAEFEQNTNKEMTEAHA